MGQPQRQCLHVHVSMFIGSGIRFEPHPLHLQLE